MQAADIVGSQCPKCNHIWQHYHESTDCGYYSLNCPTCHEHIWRCALCAKICTRKNYITAHFLNMHSTATMHTPSSLHTDINDNNTVAFGGDDREGPFDDDQPPTHSYLSTLTSAATIAMNESSSNVASSNLEHEEFMAAAISANAEIINQRGLHYWLPNPCEGKRPRHFHSKSSSYDVMLALLLFKSLDTPMFVGLLFPEWTEQPFCLKK